MRRKAVRPQLILAALVGVLLSSCAKIPTSLEEVVGWRERFFINPTTSKAVEYLTPVIALLALIALAVTLSGINDAGKGKIVGAKAKTGFLLLFGVLLLIQFIPLTTIIGQAALPPDLTLDRVFQAMRWELSPDLEKLVTASWGVAITLLLPIISRTWQGVMMLFATLALLWSGLGKSTKGIAFVLGQVAGWAVFLILFNVLVQFFGENYPEDWVSHVPGVDIAINAFFAGVLVILLIWCYGAIPIIAAILAPDFQPEPETPPSPPERERRKVDWGEVAAGVAGLAVGSQLGDEESVIACHQCGGNNPEGRRNCQYCGHNLEKERTEFNKVKGLPEGPRAKEKPSNPSPPSGPTDSSEPDTDEPLNGNPEPASGPKATGNPTASSPKLDGNDRAEPEGASIPTSSQPARSAAPTSFQPHPVSVLTEEEDSHALEADPELEQGPKVISSSQPQMQDHNEEDDDRETVMEAEGEKALERQERRNQQKRKAAKQLVVKAAQAALATKFPQAVGMVEPIVDAIDKKISGQPAPTHPQTKKGKGDITLRRKNNG